MYSLSQHTHLFFNAYFKMDTEFHSEGERTGYVSCIISSSGRLILESSCEWRLPDRTGEPPFEFLPFSPEFLSPDLIGCT